MEPIQVYIPQRKSTLSKAFDMGTTGLGMYNLGKGIGGIFGGGEAAAGTAPQLGATKPLGLGVESTYQPYEGPEYLVDPGAKEAAASGSDTFGAIAAPVAVGTAGMALGAKSQGDYQMKGNRAGNAKYAEKDGLESENRQTANWWNSDTVSRRMDLKKQFNPKEITDLLPEVERLPLSRSDKDSIIGKLGEGLRLSKIFKIG